MGGITTMTKSELLKALEGVSENQNIYIISTLDGKGTHIGSINNVSLDANGEVVMEANIESVSETGDMSYKYCDSCICSKCQKNDYFSNGTCTNFQNCTSSKTIVNECSTYA